MGNLRITDQGIKLDGDAVFLEKLQTSRIQALKVSTYFIYSFMSWYVHKCKHMIKNEVKQT